MTRFLILSAGILLAANVNSKVTAVENGMYTSSDQWLEVRNNNGVVSHGCDCFSLFNLRINGFAVNPCKIMLRSIVQAAVRIIVPL